MNTIFDLSSDTLLDMKTRYEDDVTVLEFVIPGASPSVVDTMRLQVRSLVERIESIREVLNERADPLFSAAQKAKE